MTVSSEARVKTEGLTKVFRKNRREEVRAADNVTIEARSSEIFGLVGINGAGKTTTLRLLSTMIKPTAGTAWVCGYSIHENPRQVRRHIGFMSTATSVYGRLTAREMVTYFGRLHNMSSENIQKRAEELFALFDMNDFADRRCDTLSSGMKQKVSIVRTVLHDPDVMVFDEPTAGLDVLTSRTIVDFIKDCRARGKCVVFSTHIMDEVEKLCDRVAVIHGGKILACEPTRQLKTRTPLGTVEGAFIQLVGGGP